jgi:hypothetical protein
MLFGIQDGHSYKFNMRTTYPALLATRFWSMSTFCTIYPLKSPFEKSDFLAPHRSVPYHLPLDPTLSNFDGWLVISNKPIKAQVMLPNVGHSYGTPTSLLENGSRNSHSHALIHKNYSVSMKFLSGTDSY